MEGGLAAGCQRQGQKHCQHGGFEGQKMNQILHLIWAAQNSLHQGESLWTVRRDISDQTLTNSWPAVPTYLLQSLQYLLLRSGDHWPVIVINIVRSCICGPSSEVISSFLILMAFVPKWRGSTVSQSVRRAQLSLPSANYLGKRDVKSTGLWGCSQILIWNN